MSSSSAGNPDPAGSPDPAAGPGAAELPLSARQVARLFPFHIVFDRRMRVCQVGDSLTKVLPNLLPGADLAGELDLERPLIPFHFDSVLAHTRSLFLITARSPNLRLRGQMAPLPGNERIAFLCSPWLAEPGDFRSTGLTYDDFPLHDSMPEFMNVVQSQRLGMEDLRKLSERLRQQREALREANLKLVAQSAESKKLALIAARTDNGVVITDAAGRVEWINRAFEQITGYNLEDVRGRTPGSLLQGPDTDPATVEYIRRQLRQGEGFTCELLNYHKNGAKYWVGIEVQPIRDEAGSISGFMAMESDITARRETEFRRNLAFNVTSILAEATDIQKALHEILRTMVGALAYDFGAVWRLHPATGKLSAVRIWSSPQLLGSGFELATRDTVVARGVGLPGRVLSANGPICISDLREADNFPRREAAEKDGLRSGFAFPIRVGGEARGVVEFFSRDNRVPSDELLFTLGALGNQIGQFMERRDAEAERRRLVSLLNSTLESAADGIVVVDLEMRFVTWNRRFLEIWGLTETGIPDPENPDRARVIPRMVPNADEFVRRLQWWYNHPAAAGDDVIHFRDGRVFSRATQPHWMDGQIVGRIWSYRDVTEGWIAEQSLRESEERYRVISSTVSDGIVTVNRHNRIVFANQAAEQIFNYPSGGLTGRELSEIMGSEYLAMDRKALARVMRRSMAGGAAKPVEIAGRRPDGREVPIEVTFGKSHLRGERVITGTLRDITERRHAEQKVLQSMLEIEMANRAKSDFLAGISHEIRTPLNSIAGLAELLRGTRLDDDQRDMVNTVWAGSESLLNLINDLLDFSKIEAGQIENVTLEFDPLAVCERAVEIANSRARQKAIALLCTAPPDTPRAVLGDASRISQILLNLIVNGVKFTEAGSVTLELSSTPVLNGRARLDFRVRDTGIGIPGADREKIFEKFYRIDTPVGRRAGGTGLGLSIARLLAQAMGGELILEPPAGPGSCFRLSLNLPVLRTDPAPLSEDQRHVGFPLTAVPLTAVLVTAVLVTNDASAEAMRKAWNSAGVETIACTSLSAACDYLEAGRRCDLALIDGDASFDDAERERFFRLLALRAGSRCIRIRPPQSRQNLPEDWPAGVAIVDFPLTPSRMKAALRRLTDRPESADRQPGHSVLPAHESAPGSRILLVEDNPDSQAYAARVFHKAGHLVTMAESVSETLRLIKTRAFDIVLMDVMLPDGSGFDAARQIREFERTERRERMPLIALTANALREYRDRAFDADMDDYLTKPVRPEQLLQAVRDWSAAKRLTNPPEETLRIDRDIADLVPTYLKRVAVSAEEVRRRRGNPCRLRTPRALGGRSRIVRLQIPSAFRSEASWPT